MIEIRHIIEHVFVYTERTYLIHKYQFTWSSKHQFEYSLAYKVQTNKTLNQTVKLTRL